MGKTKVCRPRTWTIRYMEPRDLAQVFRITQRTPAPRWARQDFLLSFQSGDISSWVAEIDDKVVGFVVCRVIPRQERVAIGVAGSRDVREFVWRDAPTPQPLRFELLHVAVDPEHQRNSVGRALLGRFDERLRQAGDCILATVPESNLPVQLFLRALGYKASRVLRGYYGEEDAYVMERRHE
jgi:[ribosomal protein S18]-alanine N-acetyltransferase